MRVLLFFICLTLVPHFGFSTPEAGQSELVYKTWENTVSRAEAVLIAGRASEKSLEILRDEINNWRSSFKSKTGLNSDRISLIQTQFNALPSAPDDGSNDPLKIRRDELKTLLNELKVPGLRANDAFIQADTLISEIDLLLRARQTDALLTNVESPLRPSIWAQGASQSFNALFAPINEFRLIEISDAQKTNFRIQAVSIFALVFGALISWVVGLKLTNSIGGITKKTSKKRIRAVRFPISILELIFKFVSILLIVKAFHLSGVIGLKGSLFLDQIPYFSALLLFALWLPNQLFSSDVGLLSSLNLNNKLTAKSNFAGAAIILILFDLSGTGLSQASIAQDTHSFAVLLITLFASIILWRVCKSISEIENLLP